MSGLSELTLRKTLIIMKNLLLFVFASFFFFANGQSNEPTASNEPSDKTIEATPQKPFTVNLKNECPRKITIYAGDRKHAFDGKIQVIGGISNNTLYLKENDVVCIMKDEKTMQGCTVITKGVTIVRINEAGTGFLK